MDNSVVDVKPQSVIAYYCVHGKNLVMKKTLTLIRPGFFASWDRCGGGGGGGVAEAPQLEHKNRPPPPPPPPPEAPSL